MGETNEATGFSFCDVRHGNNRLHYNGGHKSTRRKDGMKHRAPLQIIVALVRRDLGCALRNPTVLACMLVPLGLCWFLAAVTADGPATVSFMRPFAYAVAAIFPTVEVGGVLTLFVMSEEGPRGTYRLMKRCGVRLRHIVAAKMTVGVLVSALITAACFGLMGVPLVHLAPIGAAAALGSAPTLLLFCACGLRCADQIWANFWAGPISFVALAPLLGAMAPAFEPMATLIASASPTTLLAGACTAIASGGLGALNAGALGITPLAMVISSVIWLAGGTLALHCRPGKAPQKRPRRNDPTNRTPEEGPQQSQDRP
jgi:hypothetical protein